MLRIRHQFTFQGFVVATALTASALALSPILDATGFPLSSILAGSIGLLLQAFPFLIIGVLLSSAIETLLTPQLLERYFPRNPWGGMAVGVAAGFCMPTCDCATVPVFARMLHKRVPLESAVVFLCAAPIINPVVIWSTWFAFPDKPVITVLRVVMGIVVALIVGTTFLLVPERHGVLRGDAFGPRETTLQRQPQGQPQLHDHMSVPSAGLTPQERFLSYMRHAHDDLLRISPYMLVGILLASSIRVFSGSHPPAWLSGHGQILSILIMMLLAFVSSLCSTSDAVIARSLTALFPTSGLLGFLVFGPMMDIKNVLMLSSMFTRRFVVRLGITVAISCFAAISMLSILLGAFGL